MKNLALPIICIVLASCQANTPIRTSSVSDERQTLSLDEVCEKYKCRKNIHVKFRTDGDPIDQFVPLFWPRVMNDVISVLPGETFYVEAELGNGNLFNLKEVSENVNPEKTISIKFTQADEDIGMMLSVNNPFEGVVLKFNMEMIDFNGNAHQTSSCPAMPKASIFESWPHPIPELIIKNPRVISTDGVETIGCVY